VANTKPRTAAVHRAAVTHTRSNTARSAIIASCLEMNACGLNQGTSGNISMRVGNQMIITPSAVPYDELQPAMLASLKLDAADAEFSGPLAPSSEWRFHADILRARPEVNAVVHAHPPYCTSLAIAHMEIPAAHYMVAAFGGNNVRCAGYHTFGTAALARACVSALRERSACLMANHGMLAIGTTLAKAMWTAVELEALARQYYQALQIGGPKLLSDAAIAKTLAKFANYGLKK